MQTGSLLAQRYRIDAQLGEGGMGVVYKAHDTLLDRPVAIKALSPHLLGEEGLKRLLREAQSAASLSHPNIVAIHDVVDEPPHRMIVMEYVQGRTLRQMLPLPWTHAAAVMLDVCRALEYAHARGVVHRDIKPENIVVTDGTAKLMDFGLALSEGRSRLTQPGMVVGTVLYMAPEQALQGTSDARSDLYALGCVFYETITGRPPFEGDDPIAVISQHINVPPVAPRFHVPDLPLMVDGLILKLLAKDPQARFRSTQDVRAALESVQGSTEAPGSAVDTKIAGAELVQAVRRGALIGREEEVRSLKALLDSAATGDGRVVLVGGQAGAGKTRLVEDLMTYAHLRGVRVLASKCYESATPYEPFVRILNEYLRSAPADELRRALGDNAADLARLVPDVRRRLGSVPDSIPLPPEQERSRLFESVTQLFLALAERTGLLLFLDDLHLADAASLALLRYFSPASARARMLVVAAYQSEESDRIPALADVLRQLRRERYCVAMEVKPLTEAQVGELIRVMANHPTSPGRFAHRIYEVTEGNPYFIEEVINALFEQGTLYIKDGKWSTDFDDSGRYADMPVPSTIRATITGRLERLSDPCRQALTQAAVLGKRFRLDVLARVTGERVTGEDEDRLLDLLEEALAARLLREIRIGGVDHYEFAQSMVREALYEGISRHRRRRMHGRIAEVLEQMPDPLPRERAGEVAHHWLEAGEEQKAIPCLLTAGEAAAALFAHDEAVSHLEQARELLEDNGQIEEATRLLERLGQPYLNSGQPERAIECYQRALAYHSAQGSQAETSELRRKIGHVYQIGWDFSRAIPILEQVLADLENARSAEALNLYLDLARSYSFSGNPERGLEWAHKALEVATDLGLADETALSHSEIGLAHGFLGRLDLSRRSYETAIAIARQSKTYTAKRVVQRCVNNLAVSDEVRGDFRESVKKRLEALKLAEEIRDPSWMVFQLVGVAYNYWMLGEWESARRLYAQAVQLGERTSDPSVESAAINMKLLDEDWEGFLDLMKPRIASTERRGDLQGLVFELLQIAEVNLWLGRLDDAEAHARRAEQLPWSPTDRDPSDLLAEILARRGQLEEAAAACDQAEARLQTLGATGAGGTLHHVRGVLAFAAGALDEAVTHLGRAIEVFDRFPKPYAKGRVYEDLAACRLTRGEGAQARGAYQSALQIYQRLGAHRSTARVEDALKRLEGG